MPLPQSADKEHVMDITYTTRRKSTGWEIAQ